MAAANTDKWRKKKSYYSSTLSSSIGASDVTIPLASATGLPTDTAITLSIDRVDANGVSTPSARERVTGVISGSNLTTSLRGEDGDSGTGKAHSSGAVVEDVWEADSWNDAVDSFLAEHNQAGTHKFTSVLDSNGNETLKLSGVASAVNEITLKNAATGAFPKIQATGEADTGINFENSENEEILILDAIASAVNEITIKNAATLNNPTVQMSGGDTNVGLDFKMKAAGYFRRPTIVEIPVGDSATNLATGDGKAFFRIPEELNGMNLTGVAAVVYTAGTTGTLDVQIRNKTDTADMLSTKITIDSAETDSSTAATPPVINAATDDVVTGDIIAIDIDAVHTTPAKGLVVQLRFELPA